MNKLIAIFISAVLTVAPQIVLATSLPTCAALQVVTAGFNRGGASGGIAYVASSYNRSLTATSLTTSYAMTLTAGQTVPMFGMNSDHNCTALAVTLSGTSQPSFVSNSDYFNDATNSSGCYRTFYIGNAATGTTTLLLTTTNLGGPGSTLLFVAAYTGLANHTLDTTATWKNGNSGSVATNNVSPTSGDLCVSFIEPVSSTSYSSLTSGYNARQGGGNNLGSYNDNLSVSSGSQNFSATLGAGMVWDATVSCYN